MRARGSNGARPPGAPDRTLWRRSQEIEASAAETERFLDLAGFVDGRLDEDEHERVAALIAGDPTAAADAAAARVLLTAPIPEVGGEVVARAAALVDPAQSGGQILAFPQRRPQPRLWPAAASWSSLAAAIAFACWLGFDLGGDLPGIASISRSSDDLGATELIDPAPLALRDFSEGTSI
jgi:anti-sigma factor RsiW